MKRTPIKDCSWVNPEDGTCDLPSNMTPECHIDTCPRLAWFVKELLERSDKLCAVMADKYGSDMPAEFISPMVELENAIKQAEGKEQ